MQATCRHSGEGPRSRGPSSSSVRTGCTPHRRPAALLPVWPISSAGMRDAPVVPAFRGMPDGPHRGCFRPPGLMGWRGADPDIRDPRTSRAGPPVGRCRAEPRDGRRGDRCAPAGGARRRPPCRHGPSPALPRRVRPRGPGGLRRRAAAGQGPRAISCSAASGTACAGRGRQEDSGALPGRAGARGEGWSPSATAAMDRAVRACGPARGTHAGGLDLLAALVADPAMPRGRGAGAGRGRRVEAAGAAVRRTSAGRGGPARW